MNRTKFVLLLVLALGGVSLLYGCFKKDPQKDAFIEKWRVAEEQGQGHSPSHKPKQADVKEFDEPKDPCMELSSSLITLRMHKASLVAVIQALARAANQSVMLSPEIAGEVTVNVKEKPWNQVFCGLLKTMNLTFTKEGDIVRIMGIADLENQLKLQQTKNKEREAQLFAGQIESFITRVIPIRYSDAFTIIDSVSILLKGQQGKGQTAETASTKSVAEASGNKTEGSKSVVSDLGKITVDTATNSLVVSSTRENMKQIYDIVNELDKPRKQIRIKAHIIETTSQTARALGIQWGGNVAHTVNPKDGTRVWAMPGGTNYAITRDPTTNAITDWTQTATLGTGSASGFGLNFLPSNFPSTSVTGVGAAVTLAYGILGGNMLETQLQALQEDSKVKILSSPSIMTLDNQPANTENGEKVPYVTTDNSGGTITKTVKFEDAVLRLQITPHVIDEEFLRLNIRVQKDEVDLTHMVDGYPLIVKKLSTTTLITRNAETVVISGLTRSRLEHTEAGLPGVKDIPLLGWLFKSENKGNSKEEVLIFITPTILKEWGPGETQKSIEQIEKSVNQPDKK